MIHKKYNYWNPEFLKTTFRYNKPAALKHYGVLVQPVLSKRIVAFIVILTSSLLFLLFSTFYISERQS